MFISATEASKVPGQFQSPVHRAQCCRAGILNPKHRAGQLHSTVHLLVVCEWERLEHVISAWQRFGVVLNQSVQI